MNKCFKLVGTAVLGIGLFIGMQNSVEATPREEGPEVMPAHGDYQLLVDITHNEDRRLTGLRTDPSEVGLWLRGEAGKSRIRNFNYNYSIAAGGYDWKNSNERYNMFYGVSLSYAKNNCDDGYIGDGKGFSYGLYGTLMTKRHNAYVDVIAKFGKINKDFNYYNGETGDYSKKSYVLSVKYGKRIQINDCWYYEPSVGYTHAHLSAVDYKEPYRDIHGDAITSKLGSLGIQFGKNVKGTDYYTKLTLLHDFDGMIKVHDAYSTEEDDMGGTWTKLAIGASRKVGKNNSFFIDLEKEFGSKVEKSYAVSLGYRHTF